MEKNLNIFMIQITTDGFCKFHLKVLGAWDRKGKMGLKRRVVYEDVRKEGKAAVKHTKLCVKEAKL